MSNFRIDVLKLEPGTSFGYKLSGTCNSGGPSNPVIVGNKSMLRREITFNTGTIPHTDQVDFVYDNLPFDSLLAPEMFDLVFIGTGSVPSSRKKKASISLLDTAYPPPYPRAEDDGHKVFSELFKIEELMFTRENFSDTANNFKVHVKMKYPGAGTYRFDSPAFIKDTKNNYDILLVKIDNSGGTSPVMFDVLTPVGGRPLDVTNYDLGLPLIIMNKNMNVAEITTRKALVYIQ